MTEADINLFPVLMRFDIVYVPLFRVARKALCEFHALRRYVRELYAIPQVRASVDVWHIKVHYFTSLPELNRFGIVPVSGEHWWE